MVKCGVAVCLEHRFFSCDGALYTKLSFPYSYWQSYLDYFTGVTVVARAQVVDQLEPSMVRVDGQGVSFEALPYYVGPLQFLRALPRLLLACMSIARSHKHFLLRSGNVSSLMWIFLIILRRPYLREYPGNVKEGVVGFAGSSLKYRLLAGFLDWFARLQGKFSKANSFVSDYCQTLYGSDRPGYVFSSFKASEISALKCTFSVNDMVNVISVGRLESEKGHRVLLDAIKRSSSPDRIKLHLVGDGGRRADLESYACSLGLNVTFYGAVTDRNRLFSILAGSDLFVIPSLTEGMPRALLEAMTVGIPCLGTSVGGIPEVLPKECLCAPDNPAEMAALIDRFLGSEALREESSARNRRFISDRFGDSALQAKKIAFWSNLYE